MKAPEEVVCTVVDYGSFISLAECLSKTFKTVYYHSPIEREFRNTADALIGFGIPNVTKISAFIDEDIIKETDLFVFPDIGYGSEQKYLRSIGKPVWGSNGADELERLRTRFLSTIEKLGLPIVPYKKVRGLTALRDLLKEVKDKWIKINEFRDQMETWFHQDWERSQPELVRLEMELGGARELVWFVVQDDLPGATEIGYDGLSVDGYFPDSSYQGYEKKNELYLGAMTDYDDLPEQVRFVNEKFAPVLQEYGYRNFFATEIRNLDGVPHFIDPTLRKAGQTMEQLLETMKNIAKVMWMGAHGELIKPEWTAKFAGSATLNYGGDLACEKVIKVKEEARQSVKLCRYGITDDVYHFPPNKRQDVGVVIGLDDTIEGVIKNVGENFEKIGDLALSVKLEGFADLLEDIQKAEKEGIEFTPDPIPDPAVVLETT